MQACRDTPNGAGGLTAVYYCGATCQAVAWPAHKADCKVAKDRRTLYRAGDIAQDLFFIFQRNTWMWPIQRVEKKGTDWLIIDGDRVAKSIVVPFPASVFPDTRDQRAISSCNSCESAVAHTHQLIRDLLKGSAHTKPFHPTKLTFS